MPKASPASGRIVLTDSGGSTQQAAAKAYYKPFEEQTGVTVAFSARPNVAMGQLKAMVMANNVEWDLTSLTDFLIERAAKDGLLDEIDFSRMDKSLLDQMLPGTVTPYSAGGVMFGTVMGYDTRKFSKDAAPQSWADFWDVKRFPGRRSMIGFSYGPMEQALLADGVSPDKLYPIDIRRALAKLDEIREHITVWTSASAQQHQLAVNQEVDLIHGFASRIQAGINDGAPFAIQWRQGSLSSERWVIPKGAKNRDLVLKFIEFALDPKRQSIVSMITGNGATNSRAIDHMPPERARILPTHPDNLAVMYRTNAAWLAENQPELLAKWTEWRARRS